MATRFNFTGTVSLNDLSSKMPWIREGNTKAGDKYETFNASISNAKNNRANVELFGMKRNTVKVFDRDTGTANEVDWENRNDEDVLKQARNVKVVNINDDEGRQQFLAEWDVIEYLKEHEYDIKGHILTITGTVSKDFYNGKTRDRFQVQNVYKAEEDAKQLMRINTEFFWNKESIDLADWKSEHKIYINGYTSEYISELKANKYVSFPLVLDASKIDFENEKHVKLLKYRLKHLGCELDGDKVKVTLKGKGYYKIAITVNYKNGAEQEEFNESMLTETQKEQLELGLKTLDELRPKGQSYGEYKTEYKLQDFDLREPYDNGKVAVDDTVEEFEDEIYTPSQTKSLDEEVKKATDEEPPINKPEEDDDEEDLFS